MQTLHIEIDRQLACIIVCKMVLIIVIFLISHYNLKDSAPAFVTKKENDVIRILQPFVFSTRISRGIEFEEVS